MNEDMNLKTLRQGRDQFLKTIPSKKKRYNFKSVLDQFCEVMDIGIHIGDLKPEHFDTFLNSKKSLSKSTSKVYRSHLNTFMNYIDSCRSEPKRLEQAPNRPSVSTSKKEHREAIDEKDNIIRNQEKTIDRLEKLREKDQQEIATWKSDYERLTNDNYALEDQVKTKGASEEHLDRLKAQIRQREEKAKELETKILSHQDTERKLALIDQHPDWEERFERVEQLGRVEAKMHDLEKENERVKADLTEANKNLEDKERVESENRDLKRELETRESHLVVETLGSIDEAINQRSNEILEDIRNSRYT